MELSPKQQTVEILKNSKNILVIGHKNPDGDFLGASLALLKSLRALDKNVDLVVTDKIPEMFKFLPFLSDVKVGPILDEGKILRINTKKVPISGMKYKKHEDYLDVILESDKNLKFEFIEIINGATKPDAIIVIDTPDVKSIDRVYDKNTELFFEVPIINIDHHAGNEYFGTVNMVDLTASSSSEILVSIFEALGVKISDADVATCLLTGIVSDTQSFRSKSTTPKSLTVAAQLLAAGGRQQEIITNLYHQKPIALMKLWSEMSAGITIDKKHRFAWSKVGLPEGGLSDIKPSDVLDAATELLSETPDVDMVLVICGSGTEKAVGKIVATQGTDVQPFAKLFGGQGDSLSATFSLNGQNLEEIELKTLKKIHDLWSKNESSDGSGASGNLWDVVATEKEPIQKIEKPKKSVKKEKTATGADVIDSALKSIVEEQLNKDNTLTPLAGIIEKKKRDYLKEEPGFPEVDVFDEGDEERIYEIGI